MKTSRRVRRGSGSYGYYSVVALICIVGISLVAVSKSNKNTDDELPRVGDHWHAALGVFVCGAEWLDPAPEFEQQANNPSIRAGLHSHGDGLLHLHPFSGEESGRRTTLGRFLKYGGWKVGTKSLKVWGGAEHKNGDKCPGDSKKGILRWTVNGEEQTSNPAEYRPQDQDVVGVYFVPKDVDLKTLGEVPSAANVQNPGDVSGDTAPVDTSVTTVGPGGSSTTAPSGATGTTTAGATSSSAAPDSTGASPTTAPATTVPSTVAETTVPPTTSGP